MSSDGEENITNKDVVVPTTTTTTTTSITYEQRAKNNGMKYTVTDVPPLPVCVLLGFQHFLTMLGATVLIPLLVAPAAGATPKQTAELISTIFFVSGVNTLLQTTVGDRLPIIQGGSFAYLPPTFSIIFNPVLQAIEDPAERFEQTIQTISGSVLIVGIVQIVLGYSGAIVPILKYISPVTIAPVIAAIGLGLYNVAFNNVATCFSMGLTQMFLSILFSQYMKRIQIGGYPIFALFPIIFAIAITWSISAILTATDTFELDSSQAACRTDGTSELVNEMPWFRFPYPGQWNGYQFKAFGIIPMLGAMLAGMIESVGDYYSCARLSGAPPPTPGIISRGLACEGFGVLASGLFGSGAGTTSYSENIGAMSLTGVGSRAVIQCAAILMMLVGCLAKIAALLASLPSGIVGGIYCVVFGLIVAVGLSNLQYVDLNSERNLLIIGFAIFNALSIAGPAGYFKSQDGVNPFGSTNAAEVALSLFSSPMIIAMISSFILDNTIAGTIEERGLHVWSKVIHADINNDPEYVHVYSLPLVFAKVFHNCGYLDAVGTGRMPTPPSNGYQAGRGDICEVCCGKRYNDDDDDDDIEDLPNKVDVIDNSVHADDINDNRVINET